MSDNSTSYDDRLKQLPTPYRVQAARVLKTTEGEDEREAVVSYYENMVQSFYHKYIPAPGDEITEDEFIQRGVELIGLIRVASWLIGKLLDYKFTVEAAETDESRRSIVERYAPLWSTSQSSLWRAWVVACKFPGVPRPVDMSSTLAYEILSGCEDQDQADVAFDLVVRLGWNVMDVRDAKYLSGLGLTSGWQLPDLHIVDGKVLYAVSGPVQSVYGSLLSGEPLAETAIALMTRRGRMLTYPIPENGKGGTGVKTQRSPA